jgi:cytochrome c5
MTLSAKSVAGACAPFGAIVLTAGILAGSDLLPTSAAERSTITAGGVTLRSVGAEFPDSGRFFPGGNSADVINNNCLACHSAGMVLTQPRLSSAAWQAEVEKMRDTYKAPIAAADIPAIVDYLVNGSNGK